MQNNFVINDSLSFVFKCDDVFFAHEFFFFIDCFFEKSHSVKKVSHDVVTKNTRPLFDCKLWVDVRKRNGDKRWVQEEGGRSTRSKTEHNVAGLNGAL